METIGFYVLAVIAVVVPAVALYLAMRHRNRGLPKSEDHPNRPHGHHRPGH